MKKMLLAVIVMLAAVSAAYAICGDGRINGNEQCDTSDFDGLTCGSYNYTYGKLTCNSSCEVSRSSCFEVGNLSCENIVIEDANATCNADPNGGFQCSAGTQGQVNASELCASSAGLQVLSVTPGVYESRELPLEVNSLREGAISYSLDGKKFRKLCDSCDSYEALLKYRYGPHNLRVHAEYGDGSSNEESTWFSVARPQSNKPGKTFWYGNPVLGGFAQGYSELRRFNTVNHDTFDEFVNTKVKISAKNLPQIENNEDYAVWLHKWNTTQFLRLGKLSVNRKSQGNSFFTGIIGRYENNWYDNPLDGYDGAFIEVEPSNYNLPYPTTETVLAFNSNAPRNFLVNGTACINGRQCMSGFCNSSICS